MSLRLREVLADGVRALRQGGIAGAERDARVMLAAILAVEPARLSLEPDRVISPGDQARFEAMLSQRIAGKPVSRIIARRAFWGRDFLVSPGVLDPRPDTETLIAAALNLGPPQRLLDLGAGSGIIAVTLLAEWPEAVATATDISPDCLMVVRSNATKHGVEARLSIVQSDWFEKVTPAFDMILSNPPYISEREMAALAVEVKDHDPHIALTPGGDGLGAYRAICADVVQYLTPLGHLLVEIGPTQAAAVAGLMEAGGLRQIRVLPDLDGRDRVVIGQKPADPAT
ncbi:MAG TPA: peptide chain release factor N(5)-glutamine methyltransferase [Aliiroseovarius sp.]|nr:peptide chain release factor N(5)-glutamine methyltransferase [Aliiroseovarius sp.]